MKGSLNIKIYLTVYRKMIDEKDQTFCLNEERYALPKGEHDIVWQA